jgi:hypothetical protein
LGNVLQLEADWQKGLESQVTHLSDKLSALCSKMKKLHQLLFVDDEDDKYPNFKHDRLGLGVKDTSVVRKIAQMYILELQTSSLNIVEKWLPHLRRL